MSQILSGCAVRAAVQQDEAKKPLSEIKLTIDAEELQLMIAREVARVDRQFVALPLPMILHCPICFLQHIDQPDDNPGWCYGCTPDDCTGCGLQASDKWKNPPHKSHKCKGCGAIWRPADVPTTGVAKIETHGRNDTVIYDT